MYEVVDLPIALSVNHSPRLTLCCPTSGAGEPASSVPVLDCLHVAEVPRANR